MTDRWKPVAVALAGAFAVGTLGGLATDIGPWYAALHKPAWQPPDWLFGPAWTTIYACVVVAAVRGWRRARDAEERRWLLALFAINACVNLGWSLLFFRLQRPDWALLEVGVLWSSVLALVVALGRRDALGGALLSAYLLWVGFASFLNLTVVGLNAPFPGR